MKEKHIAIIGGMAVTDPLFIKLKDKHPEIIIVDSVKEIHNQDAFLPEPIPIINTTQYAMKDYRDGKTMRREIRKLKRKSKQ